MDIEVLVRNGQCHMIEIVVLPYGQIWNLSKPNTVTNDG